MDNALKLKAFSVFYEEHCAVDCIDFGIKKNKITAIIGPSGCGKSSLLQGMNSLLLENNSVKISGSINIENKDINYNSLNSRSEELIYLRTHMGMVFQQPMPFPLSIEKNMSFALKYNGVSKQQINTVIEKTLIKVNLYDEVKDVMKKRANKLSGGQQQRLCIARALTTNPCVLMLDEPCSALDIKNVAIIEKLLVSLKVDITIILVTHNIAQAKRIADDVIFMLDGKIVEKGTKEQIFENPSDLRTAHYIDGIIEGL